MRINTDAIHMMLSIWLCRLLGGHYWVPSRDRWNNKPLWHECARCGAFKQTEQEWRMMHMAEEYDAEHSG